METSEDESAKLKREIQQIAEVRDSWCTAYTKVRDVLKRISDQMTTTELKENGQYENADFEGSYDTIINIARTAMEN